MGTKTEYTPAPVPGSFILLLSLCHTVVYFIAGIIVNLLDNTIPIWTIPLATYVTDVLALLTHWIGHHRWWMWWHNAHMGHHINDYPPNKFLSDGYLKAKTDNSQAYYITMVLTPIITCYFVGVFSVKMLITTTIPGILLLLFADYLHQGIHIKGFHLEKYTWFMHLRSMHYYHHKGNMMKNYAIGDFFLDFLALGFQNA